jgi:hypothetical protein
MNHTYIKQISGLTRIDTPGPKILHCGFDVENGKITLKFEDNELAELVAKEAAAGRFIGFTLGWMTAKEEDLTSNNKSAWDE